MENKEKPKRKEYSIKIGERLYAVIQKQKAKIKEATYDCVKASDYEAGEIIAKKINENQLV